MEKSTFIFLYPQQVSVMPCYLKTHIHDITGNESRRAYIDRIVFLSCSPIYENLSIYGHFRSEGIFVLLNRGIVISLEQSHFVS